MIDRIRHNSLSPIHCLRAFHISFFAYLLFRCSSLIYFSVAIVIITTKHQKYCFCYRYLLPPLPLLSCYFATKHFAADIKFPGVVELTTQMLILENILWLPLCRINKFGLNTLSSKTIAIPYILVGYQCPTPSRPFSAGGKLQPQAATLSSSSDR